MSNNKRIISLLWNSQSIFILRTNISVSSIFENRKTDKIFARFLIILFIFISAEVFFSSILKAQLNTPSEEKYTEDAALRMTGTGKGALNPVYAPLADQITSDYSLAEKSAGIGIDLGSGPGNLILELCERTKLHWINADINPHFFPHFYSEAEKKGFGHRVSAIFADAQYLPFRDNFADIIVSRGSYHFWEDKEKAFSEIYRVLKPGGVAFIGRGFARDMPVSVARSVRGKQKNFPDYDPVAEAKQMEMILQKLKIKTFRVEHPVPPNSEGVNYGVWIEIRK